MPLRSFVALITMVNLPKLVDADSERRRILIGGIQQNLLSKGTDEVIARLADDDDVQSRHSEEVQTQEESRFMVLNGISAPRWS